MTNYSEIISLLAGAFAIIGAIYAFYKWGIDLLKKLLTPREQIIYKIPKKTIVVIPSTHSKSTWWHMGSSSGKPAMQVVGRFKVTNITKYNILLTAAEMKKPKLLGYVMVKDTESESHGSYMIPGGATTDLDFGFWIVPPFKKENESFNADVAIWDQFANKHWIKTINFQYS
jgi:hypothetical protein